MNKIFGIPMTGIMITLLILLAICLLAVAWVAWRRPVIFKLGVRNIPRRRTQTTLIVVGLMLSTLIIAAALGTGDTIDYSVTAATYDQLGRVDELVVYSRREKGEGNINQSFNQVIPQGVADTIRQGFQGADLVEGVMPVLIETVPTMLVETQNGQPVIENGRPKPIQAEPQTFLIGIDPGRPLQQFGGLKSTDGKTIDLAATKDYTVTVQVNGQAVQIPGSEVVISAKMADKLSAKVGDLLVVYYNNKPIPLKVVAIAQDSPLSGRFDPQTPGMVIPLDRLQRLIGQEGRITAVGVANKGGVRGGVKYADQVTARLKQLVQGQSLGVDPIKKNSIDQSQLFANIFTGLFLVLGLFSIAVGILLIVLIFTMLAAERRSEMGMERAVGAQRRQLIQQFVSEGSGYALLAGLVGAALGVGAAFGIGFGLNALFGGFLDIRPHVTPRSLVVAYCLGVVITFLAVVGSSWRISRLNVVAAVRDIPEVSSPRRKLRTVVWAVILALLGVAMILPGKASENAFLFYCGMSLLPFGVALLLRYFGVPARPVFSLVGIYILFIWLLPDSISNKLFGKFNGGFEMFFLSGIFMVAGATILIVNNLDVLLRLTSAIGGLFRTKLPAVRMAIAYPGTSRGRTGMTIAMFSLIVFSLITFATINNNFVNLFLGDAANAGWDIRADASQANPIGDDTAFATLLKQQGVQTGDIQASGAVMTQVQVQMRRPGAPDWKLYEVKGMDAGFLANSKLLFQQRAAGYDSDAAIVRALQSQPDVAVIDQGALATSGGFGGDPNRFTLAAVPGGAPAITSGTKNFQPVPVEIRGADGSVRTIKIIGIIDSKVGSLVGLYARQDTVAALFPKPTFTSYFLRISDAGQAKERAKQIERALLANGVQATSIRDELKDQQKQSQGFLYIIQGFMGLGLIVGIAAVGVIAFRSVVERRQQIGMLRALGFQRSEIALTFLIETTFVVLLGVLSGTILGLWLSRNLFSSSDFSASSPVNFVIPWNWVAGILLITVVAALVMTWVPSQQASRLVPAEALRYE